MTLTDILAIYAAALSTAVLAREVLVSRDKLKVRVVHGAREDMPVGAAVIELANFGKRAILVRHVGLIYPWRNVGWREKLWLIVRYPRRNWTVAGWCHGQLPGGNPFSEPEVIDPGDSRLLWFSISALDESLSDPDGVFVASAQDALGRNYNSRAFRRRIRG